MKHEQYAAINESLGSVHSAIMKKEMGDDGWDLRDELLALTEVVSDLAMAVYQSHYDRDRHVDQHWNFKERVIAGLERTAQLWPDHVMAERLAGARAFAIALLVDLPEVNASQAESLADAAIAKGKRAVTDCQGRKTVSVGDVFDHRGVKL
jgi:hypothetical protein